MTNSIEDNGDGGAKSASVKSRVVTLTVTTEVTVTEVGSQEELEAALSNEIKDIIIVEKITLTGTVTIQEDVNITVGNGSTLTVGTGRIVIGSPRTN